MGICCGDRGPCVFEMLVDDEFDKGESVSAEAQKAMKDDDGNEVFEYSLVTIVEPVDQWDDVETAYQKAVAAGDSIFSPEIDFAPLVDHLNQQADALEANESDAPQVAKLRNVAGRVAGLQDPYNTARESAIDDPANRFHLAFLDLENRVFNGRREVQVVNFPKAAAHQTTVDDIHDALRDAARLFGDIEGLAAKLPGMDGSEPFTADKLIAAAEDLVSDVDAVAAAMADFENALDAMSEVAKPATAWPIWFDFSVDDGLTRTEARTEETERLSHFSASGYYNGPAYFFWEIKANAVPTAATPRWQRTQTVIQQRKTIPAGEWESQVDRDPETLLERDLLITEIRDGDPTGGIAGGSPFLVNFVGAHACDSIGVGGGPGIDQRPTLNITLPAGPYEGETETVDRWRVKAYRSKHEPNCPEVFVRHPVPLTEWRWRQTFDASTSGVPTGEIYRATTEFTSTKGDPSPIFGFPVPCCTHTVKIETAWESTLGNWNTSAAEDQKTFSTTGGHLLKSTWENVGQFSDSLLFPLHPHYWPLNEPYWWNTLVSIRPLVLTVLGDDSKNRVLIRDVVENDADPQSHCAFPYPKESEGFANASATPAPGLWPAGVSFDPESASIEGVYTFKAHPPMPLQETPLLNSGAVFHVFETAAIESVDGETDILDGEPIRTGWDLYLTQPAINKTESPSQVANPKCEGPNSRTETETAAGFQINAKLVSQWTQDNQLLPAPGA